MFFKCIFKNVCDYMNPIFNGEEAMAANKL